MRPIGRATRDTYGKLQIRPRFRRRSALLSSCRVGAAGGFLDTALDFGLLAGDGLGVDAEQHVDAVARPFGHLRWIPAGGQPRGHARVPERVRVPASGEAASAGLSAFLRAYRRTSR